MQRVHLVCRSQTLRGKYTLDLVGIGLAVTSLQNRIESSIDVIRRRNASVAASDICIIVCAKNEQVPYLPELVLASSLEKNVFVLQKHLERSFWVKNEYLDLENVHVVHTWKDIVRALKYKDLEG
jgi:hypothetical protein